MREIRTIGRGWDPRENERSGGLIHALRNGAANSDIAGELPVSAGYGISSRCPGLMMSGLGPMTFRLAWWMSLYFIASP